MPDTRTGHRVAGSIDALHDLADVLFARLSGCCDVVDAGTQPANEVKGAGTQYDEHAADAELQTEPARELADDSVDRWNSWKTLLLPSVVTRTTHRWILPPKHADAERTALLLQASANIEPLQREIHQRVFACPRHLVAHEGWRALALIFTSIVT